MNQRDATIRRLQRLRRRRNQAGFTLIELLVVITILGILAAIVSISLLGITATARNNALKAEKQTVQAAFDAMLADQHVASPLDATASGCDGTTYTANMAAFPSKGQAYAAPDPTAGGKLTVLSTHYLRETTTTSATYACDIDGNVLQKANP